MLLILIAKERRDKGLRIPARALFFEFVAQNAEVSQKFQLRRLGQPVYSGR
jgi:hypothetical protein